MRYLDEFTERLSSLSMEERALVLFALTTGLIHLFVGINASYTNLILAGLGFLGGSILFTIERFRQALAAAAVPFTAAQILLAYRSYGLNPTSTVLIDKVIQVAFILGCFIYIYRRRTEE